MVHVWLNEANELRPLKVSEFTLVRLHLIMHEVVQKLMSEIPSNIHTETSPNCHSQGTKTYIYHFLTWALAIETLIFA